MIYVETNVHLPIILKKFSGTTPDNPQHWKLVKADWGAFTSLCQENLKYDYLADLPDPVEGFSSALLSIADKTIPKTSSTPKKHRKQWFDDERKKSSAGTCKQCERCKSHELARVPSARITIEVMGGAVIYGERSEPKIFFGWPPQMVPQRRKITMISDGIRIDKTLLFLCTMYYEFI